MSTVIKNGTVVTADLTYKADVKVEGGVITEIGPDLRGDKELDASGCNVMPGGIDPHTHLEMPFMGTYSSDDFERNTRSAGRRDHYGCGFRVAQSGRKPVGRPEALGQQVNAREL